MDTKASPKHSFKSSKNFMDQVLLLEPTHPTTFFQMPRHLLPYQFFCILPKKKFDNYFQIFQIFLFLRVLAAPGFSFSNSVIITFLIVNLERGGSSLQSLY